MLMIMEWCCLENNYQPLAQTNGQIKASFPPGRGGVLSVCWVHFLLPPLLTNRRWMLPLPISDQGKINKLVMKIFKWPEEGENKNRAALRYVLSMTPRSHKSPHCLLRGPRHPWPVCREFIRPDCVCVCVFVCVWGELIS